MGRLSDGMPHLWGKLRGSTGEVPQSEGGAVLEYRLRYYHPLAEDNAFAIYSGILDVERKIQRFAHLIFDIGSGTLCVSAESIGLRMDLESRKSIEISDEVRQNMRRFLIRLPTE